MGSVANEQEYRRFSVSAEIEEKALREIYLRPFEMLVKSDHPPACIMTAYNRVNSQHVDMHEKLIKGVLRDEWGYRGLVMSDWGGTNSTVESVLAGCDLEMPGPPLRRGDKLLEALNASQDGKLEAAVDASCSRLLALAQRLGKLGMSAPEAETSRHRPETTATSQDDILTLRRIAASGMVLLKNDKGTLPLDPKALEGKKIAFIGPSAVKGASNGGGSAAMNPQYLSQPLESFRRGLASKNINATVETTPGCRMDKWLPLLSKETWTAPSESNDLLAVDFFSSTDCTGPIIERQLRESSNIDLFDSGPASLRDSGNPYSLRLTSTLTPETTGSHSFGVSSVGNAKLYINDKLVLTNTDAQGPREAFYAFGSPEARVSTPMQAGQRYTISLESYSKPGSTDKSPAGSPDDSMHVYGAQPSVRLGFMEQDLSSISEAVELARASDLVVVVIGLNEEWESEGYDRQTMDLPGRQDELVRRLLESVERPESVIVVNQSGSPVHMQWQDKAPTILQAWYGGQEAGDALADVLLGDATPSGRLPVTWPRAYTDLPFADDGSSWPGVGDVVVYKEGTRVGYRWFLDAGVEPLWWFGHGLGYSTFDHAIVDVVKLDERWVVSVQVTNTGRVAAEEVVQVYVWPSQQPRLKALAAFERTSLVQPGDEQMVEVEVRLRDVAQWVDGGWYLPGGTYTIASAKHAGDREMVVKEVDICPRYL
jgi:beta-glucosidase